jgi:hypothetical protein
MSDASNQGDEQLPALPDYGPTDGTHGTDNETPDGDVDPMQKITESEREPGTPPSA